jgi:hypothetical protein
MSRAPFYNNTIKNLIVAFGSIFDNIRIINDHEEELTVPLHYAPKEKFIAYFTEKPSFTPLGVEMVFPRMAFEMMSIQFAPERFSNPLNIIRRGGNYLYNRIPYDFGFSLYIATKQYEESLKIVESIIPFFTPELNISVRDIEDFELITDIPVILDTISSEIDYEGSFETRRTILWTLSFTLKAYLYGDSKTQGQIKETIVHLTQQDMDKRFETLISEVVPREADEDDPHEIIDRIEINYEEEAGD